MTQESSVSSSARLIAALRAPACYPHPVTHIDVLETHISWVMLTGAYAYKLKKPVNLGFLDFTSLQARRHDCEEELRLNRRYAPALYLGVVAITGSAQAPRIGGDGPAIEYAVQMREFPQQALASRLLAGGSLTGTQIDAFAARLCAIHAQAAVAARGSPHGTAEAVIAAARANFSALNPLLRAAADQALLAELEDYTERDYQAKRAWFGARHATGHVRECHGDLHLANIVLIDGELTPFDCIEFNPALRWIDVINEVAFTAMDLMDRGRDDLAYRFLNTYLEHSGDYRGLDALRFYLVYRAMVRAKVHALRAMQAGLPAAQRARLLDASRGYLALARRCAGAARPAIVLMHGYSGSGKSVLARALAEDLCAIRLRSDVERKRLSGLTPLAQSGSPLAAGIYAAGHTAATYHRLLELTRGATRAGYTVIVDATLLKHWQRDLFRQEAAAQNLPLLIVDLRSPEAVLRERIAARGAAGTDASEADTNVLTRQIESQEALTDAELQSTQVIDATGGTAESPPRETIAAVRGALSRIGCAP